MASQRKVLSNDGTRVVNNSQRLFLVYLICILVDMTILNVFAEFTHSIYVESFSIYLYCYFLQLLIVLTKQAEHKLSQFFGTKKVSL